MRRRRHLSHIAKKMAKAKRRSKREERRSLIDWKLFKPNPLLVK
jgi:hypothetical protein